MREGREDTSGTFGGVGWGVWDSNKFVLESTWAARRATRPGLSMVDRERAYKIRARLPLKSSVQRSGGEYSSGYGPAQGQEGLHSTAEHCRATEKAQNPAVVLQGC